MKITRIGAAVMMGSSFAAGLALGPGWGQARLFVPAVAEASTRSKLRAYCRFSAM